MQQAGGYQSRLLFRGQSNGKWSLSTTGRAARPER
jgi:hypothetical protein